MVSNFTSGFYSIQHEPEKKHASLVVTPLKALMQDQVQTMIAQGVKAAAIMEGMSDDTKKG